MSARAPYSTPCCSSPLCVCLHSYLQPDSLALGTAADGVSQLEELKSKPAMFDATGLVTEQFFADSLDGTSIPYFVMHREGIAMDGSHPTLLDAYGGFEISMTPAYSAGVGAGWLELGGIKVIANIRGGGEFGPAWHQAALKEKRHKAPPRPDTHDRCHPDWGDHGALRGRRMRTSRQSRGT